MNVDITKLRSGILDSIPFEFDYSFNTEELKDTGIIKLDNVLIKGDISNGIESYHINLLIKGTMILPCAVSLKPTEYPFNIEINDELSELIDENIENNQNILDIFPIIWENILVEVPPRVINKDLSDVKTEGKGWKVITGKEEKVNPELAKLKDLL